MKKKVSVGTVLILILFSVLLTFQITFSYVEEKYRNKVDSLVKSATDFTKLSEADVLIRNHFYGLIDEELLEDFLISGYISALRDPYSRYMTSEEYSQYRDSLVDSGYGIGVRLTYDHETEKIVIYSVFDGSPAATAGLRAGDVITAVDGVSAKELGFYETAATLSAKNGMSHIISVDRNIAAQELAMQFTVSKSEVVLDYVDFDLLDDNVAYIRIYDMVPGAVEQFKTAMTAVAEVNPIAILLDVRNVDGTSLEAMCAFLDIILPQGEIGRKLGREGEVEVLYSTEGSMPFRYGVLVNESTSGVSELFAAALRDRADAKIFGNLTKGNAYLQEIYELVDGSALFLTEATFVPPISPSFAGVGVKPDQEITLNGTNFYLLEFYEDHQIMESLKSLVESPE